MTMRDNPGAEPDDVWGRAASSLPVDRPPTQEDELAAYAAELAASRPPEFGLGRTLTNAVAMWFRIAPVALVLTALFYAPIYFYFRADDAAEMRKVLSGKWETWPAQVYAVVAVAFMLALLSYVVFGILSTQSVSPLRALRRGLTRMLPVLGVMIAMAVVLAALLIAGVFAAGTLAPSMPAGLAWLLALLALTPAIIVMSMWCVAIPASVVEAPGFAGAFARSFRLTAGHRLGIGGMMVLLWFAEAGLQRMVQRVVVGNLTGQDFDAMSAAAQLSSVNQMLAIGIAFSGLSASFFAVAAAVLYYALIQSKEHQGPAALASVFR